MTNIIGAILKINPKAEVTVDGDDINTCEITWNNGTTPIPKADIEAKIAELPTEEEEITCLLYTSPSPRDRTRSRMPSSA